MTTQVNKSKTISVQDVTGHSYDFDQDQLIHVAQQCIHERFIVDSPKIDGAAKAKDYIQVLIGYFEHEVFTALWLDNAHQVIKHEILFRGTIDTAAVYPREVAKSALSHNAAAVIFAHNHPSGNPEPSEADISITKRLKQALELLDVRTLDHLIVGSHVISMNEQGLL